MPSDADAIATFRELEARDDPSISEGGRSRFFTHGERRPLAIVLVHGFTSAPAQWDVFARQSFERGANVVVPRLPGHGHRDRTTHALASVTAEEMIASTSLATDVAIRAGERVVIAGISLGGALAARMAFDRDDVSRAVPISPLFGLAHLAGPLGALLAIGLACAPSAFLPWSPGKDRGQVPRYGYPRFSTRLLGRSLDLGRSLVLDARALSPSGEIAVVLNGNEPAISNRAARGFVRSLERRRFAGTVTILDGLPARHDIIDPSEAGSRIDLVYPPLHALVTG